MEEEKCLERESGEISGENEGAIETIPNFTGGALDSLQLHLPSKVHAKKVRLDADRSALCCEL